MERFGKMDSILYKKPHGNLGKICSEETKIKISIANKDRRLSDETKRKISIANMGNKSRTGQIRSSEERLKSSIALKKAYQEGRINNKGENNSHYIDGLSKTDYNAWKRRNRIQIGRQKTTLEKFGGTRGVHAPNGQLLSTIQNRHRRRAIGEMKLSDIQDVYEKNISTFKKLTCIYCLKPISFGEDQIDHILPIIRGGTHEKSNLTISCKFCNNSKHNKTFDEYIEWRKQKRSKVFNTPEKECQKVNLNNIVKNVERRLYEF